ncbi:MAG: hypothetical protein ACWA5P_12195 [bacterium]
MEKDYINDVFKNLENEFDIHEPNTGHQARFLEKLNQEKTISGGGTKGFWRPWMSIAASFALVALVFIGFQNDKVERDLASISPEMQTTQEFFTTAISAEIEKLEAEQSPEFQKMIVDALFQIELLEQDYNKLKQDLDTSGEDKRVVLAMINNFQNRIDILQNVLNQIDELKNNNEFNNENTSTL